MDERDEGLGVRVDEVDDGGRGRGVNDVEDGGPGRGKDDDDGGHNEALGRGVDAVDGDDDDELEDEVDDGGHDEALGHCDALANLGRSRPFFSSKPARKIAFFVSFFSV